MQIDIDSAVGSVAKSEEAATFEDEVRAAMKDMTLTISANSYEDRTLTVGNNTFASSSFVNRRRVVSLLADCRSSVATGDGGPLPINSRDTVTVTFGG
jgi:hypothetical protein